MSLPVTTPQYASVEFATQTVEGLRLQATGSRPWIYWILLALTIGTLVSLPLLEVDVTVRAPGVVRPALERTELRTTIGGRVARVHVRENQSVVAGQVLWEFDTAEIDERLRRNRALQEEATQRATDYGMLAANVKNDESTEMLAIGGASRREELTQLQLRVAANRIAEARADNELKRTAAMFEKGIASQRELDEARYALERTRAEEQLLIQHALTEWTGLRRMAEETLAALRSEEIRLNEERSAYAVRAPANGDVQELLVVTGSTIVPGQISGTISPDGAVAVEVNVPTSEIGMIRASQLVKLQVDAFPFTQWGVLQGTVEQVANDSFVGGTQGFKVRVIPTATSLRLPSGATGHLRKGMTLQARFLVARRSVLDLLYQRTSNWLDPRS